MKIIENLTSPFLKLHTGILFVFTLLLNFNWHDSTDPTPENISGFINLIGQIGLICWLYAIANKSNNSLIQKGQGLKLFKSFKISFLVMVFSFILLYIMDNVDPASIATESDFERGEAFTYKRIHFGLLIFVVIGALLVWRGAAKLLVSAENGEEKSFKDYYPTLLCFIFPWIGVWFVNPRVKKM
jgi:hypothetical protein